jgi:hypothetical protein
MVQMSKFASCTLQVEGMSSSRPVFFCQKVRAKAIRHAANASFAQVSKPKTAKSDSSVRAGLFCQNHLLVKIRMKRKTYCVRVLSITFHALRITFRQAEAEPSNTKIEG